MQFQRRDKKFDQQMKKMSSFDVFLTFYDFLRAPRDVLLF